MVAKPVSLANRDRHDRGLRGPLIPHVAPIYESPSKTFERMLTHAVEDFGVRLGSEMENLEISLEEIPNYRDLTLAENSVPLGRIEIGNPTKIVIYQKPIELRCKKFEAIDRLIRDTLADLIGLAIGIRPTDIDPDYRGKN